jgi:hypothetical protein
MNWFQALTNILICKALQLAGRLEYPLSILPKKNYIIRIDIDKLCEEISTSLVRRSQKKESELFNKFGKLREDVLAEGDILNMSMNLLGGKFKSKHIKFNPVKEATKIWDGKESIFYYKYHSFIQNLSQVTPIFFNVRDLHNQSIPYQRSKDKDVTKLISKLNIKAIETEGKYEFNGKSIVSHEPTLLNYWHVEFQIKDIENNLVSNTKSAWKKNVVEMALKHVISINASKECTEIIKIPTIYFKK